MLRSYDIRDIKVRQQEMLQDAERRRWTSRVNRKERATGNGRSALRLRSIWAR